MSSIARTGAGSTQTVNQPVDQSELGAIRTAYAIGDVMQSRQPDAIEALSGRAHSSPPTIAPLTRLLGPLLTVANPVWGNDAVTHLRGVEKRLLGHAITLKNAGAGDTDGAVMDCLGAISVAEEAVRLRLRFVSMRMPESEPINHTIAGQNNEKP